MQEPPGPSGDEPPPAHIASPQLMNIDVAESAIIVDTASEPPVLLFSIDGVADTGPSVPSIPGTDIIVKLPNTGQPYWTLHPVLKIPTHTHLCPECIAFINHQGPGHPSWPLVQDQQRIHQHAQYESGVSRGLAHAAERIATAEDVHRRVEDNVQRLICQRDVARDSDAASQERIANLQSQLEAIRLEHAELVRDHADAERALDHARALPRARSPIADASSISSSRRRSPRRASKKRRRASPMPSGDAPPRAQAPHADALPAPHHVPQSWTAVPQAAIHGALWATWVPITTDDVHFAIGRAASDASATACIRELATSASGLALDKRTTVMHFLIHQWGAHRNTLATAHGSTNGSTPSTTPSIGSTWEGRASSHDNRGNQASSSTIRPMAPASHTPTASPVSHTPTAWTTVKPATLATPPITTTAAPRPRRSRAPTYDAPIED
ncbi:hypothetical protein FA95DRAFT_1613309 [Auriscalpium vulgare]|uniref:Uncharacterized protein n=1 Tax=Auriscalpium vulgare TaxID=40419 RepID=A0ACB8R3C0_9AGAM|nr:hypothetical protein FA95DRAFT_1613309 [Auriscalpium vulgare]